MLVRIVEILSLGIRLSVWACWIERNALPALAIGACYLTAPTDKIRVISWIGYNCGHRISILVSSGTVHIGGIRSGCVIRGCKRLPSDDATHDRSLGLVRHVLAVSILTSALAQGPTLRGIEGTA